MNRVAARVEERHSKFVCMGVYRIGVCFVDSHWLPG